VGADLYITGIDEEDGGYYRDSYNATSILWRLGMSWWELFEEYNLGDSDSEMTPEQAEGFLERVIAGKPLLDEFLDEELSVEWLKTNHCVADDLDGWVKMWSEKYDMLVEFLNLSISENAPIYWSV